MAESAGPLRLANARHEILPGAAQYWTTWVRLFLALYLSSTHLPATEDIAVTSYRTPVMNVYTEPTFE